MKVLDLGNIGTVTLVSSTTNTVELYVKLMTSHERVQTVEKREIHLSDT